MSTKQHAERLARALESTNLAQAVKSTHADGRVTVLCRVSEGNEKKWVELVKNILIATAEESSEAHNWQSHICRNYFLRTDNSDEPPKLVWGWNVSIHSNNMSISLDAVISVIKGKRLRPEGPVKEFDEFPLRASPTRNVPGPSGKGVHTIGEKSFHPARK
jgi:hypothetical protein